MLAIRLSSLSQLYYILQAIDNLANDDSDVGNILECVFLYTFSLCMCSLSYQAMAYAPICRLRAKDSGSVIRAKSK